MEAAIARPELKKYWTPSEGAFRRFLEWLDGGVDSQGERYLEMRRRLELFFERRGCRNPEDLADETLNRVARRLEEEGTITADSPAHYCYIVAKLVVHESIRRQSVIADMNPDDSAAVRRLRVVAPPQEHHDDGLLETLETCLETLKSDERELILEYYRGELRAKIDQRRAIAARLGVTMNALSIRACRLRERLEACMKSKLGRP